MIKVIHKGKDISQITGDISWSGSIGEVARTMEFDLVASSTDVLVPKVFIKLGDLIQLFIDNKKVFEGYVFFKEKSTDSSTMKVTVYDKLIYLTKSKEVYNFKNVYPAWITKRVCNNYGIKFGSVESPGTRISRVFEGDTLYDIIMTGYSIASKRNGKQYMMRLDNKDRVSIVEKGKNIANIVLDENNILKSTYSESIENMINRVRIIDGNNKRVGLVDNKNWIKNYGLIQDIYKKEDGVNANNAAKNMLQGVEKDASIEALGQLDYITGNAVHIKEPHTGLIGVFYIDSDIHTIKDGRHTVSLGLSFKNIMDFKESGSKPEK